MIKTGLTEKQAKLEEQLLISAFNIKYLDNARREISVLNIAGYAKYCSYIAELYVGIAEDEIMNLVGK